MTERVRLRDGWRLAALAVFAVLAACASAPPSTVDEARIQRLATQFQMALPIADVVALVAQADPRWPLQDSERATREEIRCVRAGLTPEHFKARQTDEARSYARANPERLDVDLALLEGGAAQALGHHFMAGVKAQQARRNPTPEDRPSLSPQQEMGMVNLLIAAEHDALRRAMRIDGIAEAIMAKASGAPERKGFQIGASLIMGPLIQAMNQCNVSFVD